MIRVNLQEIHPVGGIDKIVEMPAVPRVGDSITFDLGRAAYEVRMVIWTLDDPRHDVLVHFR